MDDNRKFTIEMRALACQIKRYMERMDEGQSPCAVNMPCGWLISHIAGSSSDVFQRDIERCFGISRSAASKMISMLELKGLIERRSVPHDARLKRLVLTQKAKALTAEMERKASELDDKLTEGFSMQELEQLFCFIDRMKKNITRPADE